MLVPVSACTARSPIEIVPEDKLQRIASLLESQADDAFIAFHASQTRLGSPLSEVTKPLFLKWQELEEALFLVRCIL